MYNADEKKAFEDMLAEIADSDEEEEQFTKKSAAKPSARFAVAESKNADVSSTSAKYSGSSSGPSSIHKAQSFKMSKEEEDIERYSYASIVSCAFAQARSV